MRIKLSAKSRISILIAAATAAALFVFAAAQIVEVKNRAAETLEKTSREQSRKNEIAFTKTVRQPLDAKIIEIWQSTQNVRAVAHFKNSIFAATDGGLVQFSRAGETEKHFTVVDGLPESDLTALQVFGGKLFIGSAASGLICFDGEKFENYRWQDRAAKSINALLARADKLLIGTFAGGLIEFDGSRFREIKPENQTIKAIVFLSEINAKLFVGTFDNGLWLLEAERWRQFTAADGLPSNRIVGAAISADAIFVGTDFGVAQARANHLFANVSAKVFHKLRSLPALSSLTSFQNQIFACRDNGEIFVVAANGQIKNLETDRNNDATNARLTIADETLWQLSNRGIRRIGANNRFGVLFARFDKTTAASLSSNTISAIAVDRRNRVWAGTFRDGINVLSGAGKLAAHLENENLREINFLSANENVIAATAHGVVSFDDVVQAQTLTENNGLLSDSVMHVLANGDAQFFATSRGLSFVKNKRLLGLTAANGLPSNNVYAALFYKDQLFVGTLGGLARIENGRVVRTFTNFNSKITNNWVSALCQADERLFIGTYGGAVLELDAAGELHSFAHETGNFAVNPNAMFADDKQLFVGTLDGAFVLDLKTQKWTKLFDELPAKTVLSIAGDAQHIYFGTTGGIAKINRNYWADNTKNE